MAGRRRWLRDSAPAALIWLAACALAVLVSHAGVAAAALPAAIAVCVTAVGFRWPGSGRAAAAAALLAAAVEPATVLPWTLAAVCLAALSDRATGVSEPVLSELQRYLERCRRRGEPATVLLLDMEADATALRNLLRCARVTDSLVVRRSRSRFEVYALLDGSELTRANVKARFAEALHGVTPAFGWASYPDDGLTLDALLEQARTSIVTRSPTGEAPAAPHAHPATPRPHTPAPRPQPAPPRLQPTAEPMTELGAEHA